MTRTLRSNAGVLATGRMPRAGGSPTPTSPLIVTAHPRRRLRSRRQERATRRRLRGGHERRAGAKRRALCGAERGLGDHERGGTGSGRRRRIGEGVSSRLRVVQQGRSSADGCEPRRSWPCSGSLRGSRPHSSRAAEGGRSRLRGASVETRARGYRVSGARVGEQAIVGEFRSFVREGAGIAPDR